jgi:hypothetical protein
LGFEWINCDNMKPKENKIDFSAYSKQEKMDALDYIFKDMKYKNTQPRELLFNENDEINIDLWPSVKWTQEELESFKNVFNEFGDTSGQISNEPRGLMIETAIVFISVEIAKRFFGKCGDDAHDFLKGKIKDLLLKRDSNGKLEVTDIDGYLNLKYDDTNTNFYYACFYSSEKELISFLSDIHKINSIIRDAQALNLFPFNKCNGFEIHVEFGKKTNYDWDIQIRRYIQERRLMGKLIVFNEFQKSIIRTEELDELQWKNIKWKQSNGKTDLETIDEYAFRKLEEMKEKK